MISSVKRILIPTDFSECSKNALKYASAIAGAVGARITLLHVIDPPFNFPSNIDGVLDYLQENAEQHLEKMKKSVTQNKSGEKIKVDSKIRIGKPVSQILEAIDDLNIDLITLGSATENSSRKALFGSVSTDILLKSHKPVLAIPENITSVDFSNILFTTNFRHNDMRNLEKTADFASLFDSDIHVLHVSEKSDLSTDIKFRGLKELTAEKEVYKKVEFHLKTGKDFFDGISDFVKEYSISMIVMNRYKKSVVGMLMEKNHTKQMSIYTTVPILVFVGDKEKETS